MDFIDLLEKAIDSEGGVAAEVARKMGVSKTTVSLMRQDKYPVKTNKHERKLKEAYAHLFDNQVICPVLGEIHNQTCKKYKRATDEGRMLREGIYSQVKDLCAVCKIGENLLKEQ